jgi:FkbM family methyltransferase
MKSVYFQIGTNDGNDLFRDIVLKNKPDIIILVEPNKDLYNDILKNYNNISNVYIYTNAIYYNDNEEVELFIPTWGNHGHAHFSLLPMNDWGNINNMKKIKSKSITFDKICNNHNITNIDYLQIDTEGFDSEIIQMIDLSKYKIKTIRFEKWNFKTECFSVYHKEKSNKLGEAGMKLCIDKLKKNNYQIRNIQDQMGNDFLATLIE